MAYDWTPASVGVGVYHRLCHEINERGYKAYMMPCVINPAYNTPLWSGDNNGPRITVYTESQHGNQYSGDVVARWFLRKPTHKFFGSDDIFFYWESFCLPDGVTADRLWLPFIDKSIFKNLGVDRTDICYHSRKFESSGWIVPKEVEEHCISVDSIHAGDRHTLAALYNRSRYIICFEETGCSMEAAFCGCPTMWIKTPFFNPDELENRNGACFDVSGLQEAIDTIPEKIKEYDNLEAVSGAMVDRFIEKCVGAIR
jgi:hypothetical protein